ncbi:hypothetical protein JW905_01240 [bacterium]|nr:hypothetical protein [candidate division CSSED10-310 bacterium]
MTGSLLRALAGSVLGAALGMLVAVWSGKVAIVGFLLLCPFLAARFGFGFMAYWWPWRRIALTMASIGVGAAVILLVSRTSFFNHLAPAVPSHRVTALCEIQADSSCLVLGTRRLGLVMSTDQGATWTEVPGPGAARVVTRFYQASDAFYVIAGGELFQGDPRHHLLPVTAAPTDITAVLAAGDRLWIGTGDGVRCREDGVWHDRSAGLFTIVDETAHGRVSCLDALPDGTLFAGIMGGGVFRREASGGKWDACGQGLRQPWVQDLLGRGMRLFVLTRDGVYTAHQPCARWQPMAGLVAGMQLTNAVWSDRYHGLVLNVRSEILRCGDAAGPCERLFAASSPIEVIALGCDGSILYATDDSVARWRDGTVTNVVDLRRLRHVMGK